MEMLLKVLNSVHLWRGLFIGFVIAFVLDKIQ